MALRISEQKKSGELFWESALISPILNEKNEISGYLAIKEDITEKKKATEELLNSKKQFQNLVENISGVYWVNNLEPFQTLYISPSYETIWGRKCEYVYSNPRDFINAIHPEDRLEITKAYEKLSDTLKAEVTYRIIKPGGSIRWISAKAKVVVNSKGNKMEYGYAEDITERMQAEIALKESEESFRRLFNESADPVLLLDENGFVDFNHSAVSILGYNSKEEVINKTPWDISPEKQPEGKLSIDKAKAMISKALEIGYNRFEWIHTKSDGTEFPVEVMLTSILLKGKQIFYTLWRDITDRKKAEHEKQMALERYDILSRATSDTIWDWDIIHNTILYNEGITKMFGYNMKESEGVIDWWNDKLHPDDRQKVFDLLKDVFENTQTRFQLNYRFRCADGTYKNIFNRAFILFDDKGKPARVIGAMQDITYQMEEEARISNAILNAHEEERRFIGAELHDNINQILAGTLLTLGLVKPRKGSTIPEYGFVEKSMGYIQTAIDEIRKLSHQLAPTSFEDKSLKEIFENLLMVMNLNNQFTINFQYDETNKTPIPDEIQLNLYRILQEQMKNIVKYSEASFIEIALTFNSDRVKMRIYDNGKGFNITSTIKGIGLKNIKKRIQSLSGNFFLSSAPGKGCEIIAEIPLLPVVASNFHD